MKRKSIYVLLIVFSMTQLFSFSFQEKVDYEMVSKIWEEGINRSQAMKILSYLTDVLGPRVPGSPQITAAYKWTAEKFEELGMSNVHIEPFGEFGLGWSNEYVSVHMRKPSYQPIIAYPVPWTSETNGKISGAPVSVDIKTEEDFKKYRGKLKGAIVLMAAPRKAPPTFTDSAVRLDEKGLAALKEAPIPVGPELDSDRPSPEWIDKLEEFFRSEGVGVLVEPSNPSRCDYGTVKVDAYKGKGWDPQRPRQNPRIIMAAEHYARIFRIMDHKIPVILEVEIRNTFYDEDQLGYNVIAEIPGSDKKDEAVMLGGHIDSWSGGTGAVDNAAGCTVVMEAMRILKSLGVKPRRTIRGALWGSEEQGLLGSRGYVAKHFGDSDIQCMAKLDYFDIIADPKKFWRNIWVGSNELLLKPEHGKLSAYYNYDNGSGRIRGVYLQENSAVEPIFKAWIEPLRDLGVTTLAFQETTGSDHLAFDYIGLPGFQFIQEPLDYGTRVHHTNMDLYDHCIEEDIIQSAIVMACFVYHTAMRDELLPRKPLPKMKKDSE
ncbi:MAG: M20/M25/M40 family metallo-hydrolase [Candidatus Aminicenantes bacterium]|nr:M20/M25/M40 family metallo-hydrolase [Candidatus Aminicenantes bacterium]